MNVYPQEVCNCKLCIYLLLSCSEIENSGTLGEADLGKDARFVSKYSLRPFCTCSKSMLHSFSLSSRRASAHSSIT